ncbi:MAG: HNH endonuclease [Bacteroidia bacterium]
MAAQILPACTVCGKPTTHPRHKTCSFVCRSLVAKPRPPSPVERAILSQSPSLSEWVAAHYLPDGCNLTTAGARIGFDKSTLWAFLKRKGFPTKDQSKAQSGALNGFSGRKHRPESLAIIGQASRDRQNQMVRRETGNYGDGPPLRGEASGAYVNGIGFYRRVALQHYGTACQRCAKTPPLRSIEVHHLDEDRTNNSIANLRVLCISCHRRIHSGAHYDPSLRG